MTVVICHNLQSLQVNDRGCKFSFSVQRSDRTFRRSLRVQVAGKGCCWKLSMQLSDRFYRWWQRLPLAGRDCGWRLVCSCLLECAVGCWWRLIIASRVCSWCFFGLVGFQNLQLETFAADYGRFCSWRFKNQLSIRMCSLRLQFSGRPCRLRSGVQLSSRICRWGLTLQVTNSGCGWRSGGAWSSSWMVRAGYWWRMGQWTWEANIWL